MKKFIMKKTLMLFKLTVEISTCMKEVSRMTRWTEKATFIAHFSNISLPNTSKDYSMGVATRWH